jgi:hypothetical protein
MRKPLGYHPNWGDAPKDIMQLHGVFPLNKYNDVSFVEQMAKIMSHVVYGEGDIPLDEIHEGYRPYVEQLLPTLENLEGGIYDLAAIAAQYVIEQKRRGADPQNMKPGELQEEVQKEMQKKQQAKGEKGGPEGGLLWRGKPRGFFFGHEKPEVWPELANMDIIKNGISKSPKLSFGKPKVCMQRIVARKISDLKYCTPSQLTLPVDLFWLKFAQGEIHVNVPKKQVTQKQIKIVFLDDSSSMSTPHKVDKIRKIFQTLCAEVINGNSIMYFSPFLYQRNPLWKIETKEDVEEFMRDFREGSGGGTGLYNFLPKLVEQLKTGMVDGLEINSNTEILIVNDGEDPPGEFESPVPIHCISVDEINHEVKDICNASGGQYYQYGRTLQLL